MWTFSWRFALFVAFAICRIVNQVGVAFVIRRNSSVIAGGLPETLECSFDLDLCSFQQDEQDDFEWVLRSGKTVTFDTGPDCDPLNCLTGKYLYIESSRPRMLGDTAVLKTPVTGGEGKRCLSFYYHMYGIHIGSLVVRQISALTRSSVTLWAMSGDQGNRWHSKHIEFDSMEAYWISLTATVGNGYKGDIAIDSISLTFGRCTASMRFDCSFKHDLCGWMNAPLLAHALQWSRHTGETDTPDTGPSGDRLSPTGYYLYVEASRTLPGDAAHLVSPALTGSSQGHCLVFWYHMYGENSGNLTVYSQTEQGQDSVLWSVHGNQGENWHSATVNVSSVPGESFNIVFEATMAGWKGDVAIDDVSIRYTRCGS